MYRAIGVAQNRAAKSQHLNRTLEGADFDDVSDIKPILHQDEESIQNIMNKGLRAKTHGKTGNSGTGQQRLHVNPEVEKNRDNRKKYDGRHSEAANNRREGVELLHANAGGGQVRLIHPRQPPADQVQKADQHEGDDNRDKDLGKLVVDQDVDILVPNVQPEQIMPGMRKLNRFHEADYKLSGV